MADKPFTDLKITSSEFLDSLQGRSECPKCKRSRKYYCYTCYVPLRELEDKIPSVKLPMKIDIIKHPSEVDGKSTSAHAKVLSPDDVTIYTYPCIPDYPRDGSVVLVFPSENAVSISKVAKQRSEQSEVIQSLKGEEKKVNLKEDVNPDSNGHFDETQRVDIDRDIHSVQKEHSKNNENDTPSISGSVSKGITDKEKRPEELVRACKRKLDSDSEVVNEKLMPFERAVFIDSTWNQTKTISTDERLKGIPCIILSDKECRFWRHQKENPASYLSTIEAIYYLVRDYHDLFISTNYDGEYDNLLFFFLFMYNKIHGLYAHRDLKADLQRKKIKK